MKDLFVAIQDRLIAEVPELEMIDFDLGQLEQEPLPSLSYPAALISFGESTYEDLSRLSQQATILINIRFVFRTFERTHSINEDQYRAIGLAHLDIVTKAKWKLHGFGGENFTRISHRNFATEPRADLRVYSLTFETIYTDTPPEPQHIPWTDSGGQGAAPDICLTDPNTANPIE